MRTALASILAALAGAWVLWSGTEGGRAFTAEGARRLAVEQHPREVPNVVLEDQRGRLLRMADLKGKLVVLDFIYTRCSDLCIVVGSTLQRIRDRLPEGVLGSQVAFLSISFDPRRDAPESLAYYAGRHRAGYDHWRVARVAREKALPTLLSAFGVKVLPDGWGGYQHNAAVYVLDQRGRLVRIFDYDDPDTVVRYLNGLLLS
jgi:protein SCO1/2